MTHLNDTTRPGVLEIVQEYAPRPYKINPNTPKNYYAMSCPVCGGPYGKFSVNEDNIRWTCWTGCGAGGPKKLRELLTGFAVPAGGHTLSAAKAPRAPKEQEPFQGCTIVDLAAAKGLDPEILTLGSGWQQRTDKDGLPYIDIPYPDENGGDIQWRRRKGLDQGEQFRWKFGSKARPYALNDRQIIKDSGQIILVEGETDHEAGRQRGIPTQGLPGANMAKPEWAKHWEEDTRPGERYVWQEPGQSPEEAPGGMVARCAAMFPDIKVIVAPENAKDIVELAALYETPEEFRLAIAKLMSEASQAYVPLVVTGVLTTSGTYAHRDGYAAAARAVEMVERFPTPTDDKGHPIRPDMGELCHGAAR